MYTGLPSLGLHPSGGGFNPASALFSNGEPGGLYYLDDALAVTGDSTFLWQSPGLGPVTAIGQAVGIYLDRRFTRTVKNDVNGNFANWRAQGLTPPTVNTNDTFLGSSCNSVTFPVIVAPGGFAESRADGALITTPGNGGYHLITLGYFYRYEYEYALSRPLVGTETIVIYTTGSFATNTIALTSATPAGWQSGYTYMLNGVAGAAYPVIYASRTDSPVTVYLRRYIVKEYAGNHRSASGGTRPVLQVDGAGALHLLYDGIDDFMSSPMDLSSTDKVTVIGESGKLTDPGASVFYEHTTVATNPGGIGLYAPGTAGPNYSARSTGDLPVSAITTTPFAAPTTNAISIVADISGDLLNLYANNVLEANQTADQGVGNYANATSYYGARAGTSLFYGGREYALLIRGALTSGTLLTQAGRWVSSKAKIII